MLLFKNPLMPLFLMGCFPVDFQEGKRPIKGFGERPIKVGKRPIKEGKRPINANGQFAGTPPWWKTAPLKRPIKWSMSSEQGAGDRAPQLGAVVKCYMCQALGFFSQRAL